MSKLHQGNYWIMKTAVTKKLIYDFQEHQAEQIYVADLHRKANK